MLRVSVNQAQPGMVLALPVAHPHRPEAILLRTNAELDSFCIPRLRELGVREVWVRYPGMEDMCRYVSPALQLAYQEMMRTLGLAFDSALVESNVEIEYSHYKKAVTSVIDHLTNAPQAALFVAEIVNADRPFLRHCGTVAALSLLMGLRLDFYLVRERGRAAGAQAKDLSGLGVGAMLHDIGMTRLADGVLDRWNATRDETDEAWREHVKLGYHMVKESVDAAAASVVLHHHQRYDGTGFPARRSLSGDRAMAGSDVHIFARIVGCADVYDRIRNPAHAPRSSDLATPPIPAVRALRCMLQDPVRGWVDPVVVRALLAVAPPFSPGSVVTLTDGRSAAVVDFHASDPCRPTVEVIDPLQRVSAWKERARERINLRKRSDVSIAEIDGHDVRGDLFFPSYEGEFDFTAVARNVGLYGGPPPTSPPRAGALIPGGEG